MNIASITRYKHGNIYKLLQKLEWSQLELARRSGLCGSVVGNIINLQRRPNEEQANAIQRAFGEADEYLDVLEEWPDAFRLERGFKREEVADVPVGNLLYSKEMLALEFESTAAPKELVDGIEAAMDDLDVREKKALEGFMDGRTLKEIGKNIKVSNERCRQIQMRALQKLRRPSRIQKLNCDKADEEIENQRRRDAEYTKEVKKRQEQYAKEAEEMYEKERAKQKKLETELQSIRDSESELFNRVGRVLHDPYNMRFCVSSTTGETMISGREQVVEFIRKFIDPEWRGPWADYRVTHKA